MFQGLQGRLKTLEKKKLSPVGPMPCIFMMSADRDDEAEVVGFDVGNWPWEHNIIERLPDETLEAFESRIREQFPDSFMPMAIYEGKLRK